MYLSFIKIYREQPSPLFCAGLLINSTTNIKFPPLTKAESLLKTTGDNVDWSVSAQLILYVS